MLCFQPIISSYRESQFLGRLIRSPGSSRRRQGSGIFSRRRKGQVSFSSPLRSLVLITLNVFYFKPKLMITQETIQFKLCTKAYIAAILYRDLL